MERAWRQALPCRASQLPAYKVLRKKEHEECRLDFREGFRYNSQQLFRVLL